MGMVVVLVIRVPVLQLRTNMGTFPAARCLPKNRRPLFDQLQDVLLDALAQGDRVRGGIYYPATLRKYRRMGDLRWTSLPAASTPLAKAERDRLTMELMWECVPRKAIAAFQKSPSRCTFQAAYRAWRAAVASCTAGVCGDYMCKCQLDCLQAIGMVGDRFLSEWPTACPGYLDAMSDMFPAPSSSDTFACLCWWHAEITKHCPLRFFESTAQLCWNHRRDTGALREGRTCALRR